MSPARQLTLFDAPQRLVVPTRNQPLEPALAPEQPQPLAQPRVGSSASSVDATFSTLQRWQLVASPHPSLVPASPPAARAPRSTLRGAASWVDHAPRWLRNERQLFEALLRETRWQAQRRKMYDRWVDVPRLLGEPPIGTAAAECLREVRELLSARYLRALDSVTLAHYRDGSDSVAPHGDKLGPLITNTVVAIVSLGFPRTLALRPVRASTVSSARRAAIRFELGQGDLFVMGGRCQVDWLHAVPKVRHAGPRISLMFRERVPELSVA